MNGGIRRTSFIGLVEANHPRDTPDASLLLSCVLGSWYSTEVGFLMRSTEDFPL